GLIMSETRRRRRQERRADSGQCRSLPEANVEQAYRQASLLVEQGRFDPARSAYWVIAAQDLPPRWRALIENDLGALNAFAGDTIEARVRFEKALAADVGCDVARQNLTLLDAEIQPWHLPTNGLLRVPTHATNKPGAIRVAILSLLFNWPSTGGGTVHTAELGKFLQRAGYDVRHIYAQYPDWGVGNVT